MKDWLSTLKQGLVEAYLVEFLKSRSENWRKWEIEAFLMDHCNVYDECDVENDLRDKIEEDAHPKEKDQARLELWSQEIYAAASQDERRMRYRKAINEEEIGSLS